MLEAPHPIAPFTVGRNGTEVCEQGSEDNIASNVYNIAVCPFGFREDLPEYGMPAIANQHYPVDLDAIETAIHRWEPEADLSLEQQRLAIGEAGISISV